MHRIAMKRSPSDGCKPKAVSSLVVDYPAYTDYADKSATWVAQQIRLSEQSTVKTTAGGPKVTFPIRLHDMLADTESKNQTSIVSWLPHGRGFKVHDRRAFMTIILPVHFKYHSSFATFQKQLNAYGYIRLVGQHDDQNAYYHELFLRGRSFLCALMSRQGAKHSERYTYNPATEPNLYGMKHLHLSGAGVSDAAETASLDAAAPSVASLAPVKSKSVALDSTAHELQRTRSPPKPLMDNSQAAALESPDLQALFDFPVPLSPAEINEPESAVQSANQDSKRPAVLSITEHSRAPPEHAGMVAPSGATGTAATMNPMSPLAASTDIQGLPLDGATGASAGDSKHEEQCSTNSASSISLGVDLFEDQSIPSKDDSLTLSCGSTCE